MSGLSARRKRAAGVTLTAAAMLALAACSSSGTSGSSAGGSGTANGSGNQSALEQHVTALLAKPTKINQTAKLPSPPPSGKSVIFVNSGLAATQRIAAGVHEAADALKWSYSEVSYDPGNAATLQSALRNALAKKPSAVFVTGNPQSQYGTSTIAQYKQAGVPIIVGSVAPVQLGDPIYGTPAGAASEKVVGKALADWFIVDSKGSGGVILENYTSAPVLNVFRDAFIAEVKAQCPGCKTKVVSVTNSDVAGGTLVPKTVAAARQNPDYKYMFFDNGQFADGVLSALSSAGLSGLKVGGRSVDPVGASALANGTEAVWTGQSYYLQGQAMVDLAIRVMTHAPATTGDDVIPVQLLTKDNIGELKGGQFNLPANSLQQYEKLWGVPITGGS